MLDQDFVRHVEELFAQGDKADSLAARGAFVRLRDALGAGEVRAAEPDASQPTGSMTPPIWAPALTCTCLPTCAHEPTSTCESSSVHSFT